MNCKPFSRNYRTFWQWFSTQKKISTRYTQRIVSLHELFPTLTLKELTERNPAEAFVSHLPWDTLTIDEKYDRIRALELLSLMRDGTTFKSALQTTGLSKTTAIRHLNLYLYRIGQNWQARDCDGLEVMITFFTKEKGIVSRLNRCSCYRDLVAKYMKTVEMALINNDPSLLSQFNQACYVGDNELFEFETDLKTLYVLTYSLFSHTPDSFAWGLSFP